MLKILTPEQQLITKQIFNCEVLIEILYRQIAEGRPESNLDYFSNKCGTSFCLLGDYLIGIYLQGHDSFNYDRFAGYCSSFYVFKSESEFGFLCHKLERIFGKECEGGTRQERIERLNTHISGLYDKLGSSND